MKEYGLIGKSLSHSFSPAFFNEKFKKEGIAAQYNIYEIGTIEKFPELLENTTAAGYNVTIPFKSDIIPYLDDLTPEAAKIGAVNCIQTHKGRLIGFNTDYMGFKNSLIPLLQPFHTKALVLGTGGAAKAVRAVLENLHIDYKSVTTICYEDVDAGMLQDYLLIINTTPLGMFPDVASYPLLPYEALNQRHLLYDLIYNPALTAFLEKGKAQGAQIKNGAEMLVGQALASWEIWNE
jgi:shikimate dehydrogenase